MIFLEYYSALSVCISTVCGLLLGSQGAFRSGNVTSGDFRLMDRIGHVTAFRIQRTDNSILLV